MYEKVAICCIYDKISAGFYRVQILRKPMKTLHFYPLVLFLLHYEFIFTPMRVPWNFHGISAFELFVLKRIFSDNTPVHFEMAMPQFTPQQKAFIVSEFLRSSNINLVRQSFTNEYPDANT
jgi:hypothetical protein